MTHYYTINETQKVRLSRYVDEWTISLLVQGFYRNEYEYSESLTEADLIAIAISVAEQDEYRRFRTVSVESESNLDGYVTYLSVDNGCIVLGRLEKCRQFAKWVHDIVRDEDAT